MKIKFELLSKRWNGDFYGYDEYIFTFKVKVIKDKKWDNGRMRPKIWEQTLRNWGLISRGVSPTFLTNGSTYHLNTTNESEFWRIVKQDLIEGVEVV